jgi:ATP-binding cassette, subfamily A (ABC1), member 3
LQTERDRATSEMVERSAAGGFTLLMWKNWLLQRRHPVQSLIEIGAPVVFAILLVVIRSLVGPVPFNKPFDYEPFSPTRILSVASNGTNLFGR